ncbi:MAG: hypothetical protein PVG51_02480 [Desulfosarcina sp.]
MRDFRKWHVGVLMALQLCIILSLTTFVAYAADENGATDADKGMTEAVLQGHVMAFADRYWSIMNSAGIEYIENKPSPEKRRIIKALLVYSAADAFTIAAGPKPVAAFLDMVVMVTLGRMVCEQHYAKIHGSEVAPIIDGFKKAEADIWQIASDILTDEQQQKLMGLIQTWRQNNPKNIVFSSVRFSEFEKFRGFSDDSGETSSGGLFRSVAKATEQVEEMRLISERAMYLGSRLPMLTGAFADVWTSRLTNNQDVNVILADVNRIADGLQRIAAVSEKLPDDIAEERDTTIDRLVQEVAKQRRETIDDFLAEEKRIRGLLTDFKVMLASGNELLNSTNATLDRLNFGQGEMGAAELSRPFDIRDYQAALQEASRALLTLHELVKTIDQMGLENRLPAITKAMEKIGQQGEEWLLQAFMLGVVLILVLLIGSVFAIFAYRYLTQKLLSTEQ